MSEGEWLAEQFEQHRGRLRAVAFRMLGSPSEAEDAVQEAWLRPRRCAMLTQKLLIHRITLRTGERRKPLPSGMGRNAPSVCLTTGR